MKTLLVLAIVLAAGYLFFQKPVPEAIAPAAAAPAATPMATPRSASATTPVPGAWMRKTRNPLQRGAYNQSGPGETYDTVAAEKEARAEARK